MSLPPLPSSWRPCTSSVLASFAATLPFHAFNSTSPCQRQRTSCPSAPLVTSRVHVHVHVYDHFPACHLSPGPPFPILPLPGLRPPPLRRCTNPTVSRTTAASRILIASRFHLYTGTSTHSSSSLTPWPAVPDVSSLASLRSTHLDTLLPAASVGFVSTASVSCLGRTPLPRPLRRTATRVLVSYSQPHPFLNLAF